MNIIGKSKILIFAAGVIVALSFITIAVFGLHPSIDLVGGTEWQISFLDKEVSSNEIKSFLTSEFEVEVSAKEMSTGDIIIRLPDIDQTKHQAYKKSLETEFGEMKEKSFSSVGPIIGQELKEKAMWAMLGVLLGISLFVIWAFRKVSGVISSWKYGITTLVTLVHDIAIPTGLLALLGYLQGVEVSITSIVALLVILGFSVNDTIVVMDRIRENLTLSGGKKINLKETINKSVNETIIRSVNTSLTLIIVLLFLLFLGPQSLFYFVLIILVGTIFGTYSSIFVASPILYLWGREK